MTAQTILALHHPLIAGALLCIAVVLVILCALGIAIMRDPFQRLHFSAVVVTWSIPLVTVAVWVENPDWQARIKTLLIAALLFWMNSILTHATARAIRLRQARHLEPRPGDGIEPPEKE